jgi:hypothetical protein
MIHLLAVLQSMLPFPVAYLFNALGAVLVFWALWVFFLAVMALQAARDRGQLTGWGRRIGLTVLVVGYTLDLICQLLCTGLFLEPPPLQRKFPFFEATVSARVKRLIANGQGWRQSLATWLRDHLLKPFDVTGRHG